MDFKDGTPVDGCYAYLFDSLKKLNHSATVVDDTNVLQEANPVILKILDDMLVDTVLPGSGIDGIENAKEFLAAVNSGKRGIILMEHYSNFDLPGFSYLMRKSGVPELKEIAERVVAIAGMKLSEENPMISAWASAYARVVIYPSRSLASISDPEERAKEEQRSRKINMASMRALDSVRKQGKILLVFPAGTRYRKNKPETKRGVREIDSYIRLSDVMLPVAINGNCLRISDDHPSDMIKDEVWHDKMVYTAGKMIECKSFRKSVQDNLPEELEDKKQPVVDKIMEILEGLHEEAEKKR
ncbi:MAG: 1-acyl-sn-glycerol-3-phosphate acyltransferase [Spirochaetaceae bacterium]|nr:1-acyl-sn-glycerol-3-phosphate acyltransferase [Spirochaetaceae bacterium]MBR3814455.1 1-acyl-sn-glycerol-3-phosphate acyltransferase [Spirochaetaceae bacterium]MDD6487892.1 1-acyl-sn-glycerol-3-phosphate acyltransferase [Spirochaetales bacterium]